MDYFNFNRFLVIFLTLYIKFVHLEEQYLLVDQLRNEFLELERKLQTYVMWEAPAANRDNAELHLIEEFHTFDEKLKLIPEDTLESLTPIKHIQSFVLLYPELRQTNNLYEKFRQYMIEHIRFSKMTFFDQAFAARNEPLLESNDIVRDILNPKIGANATIHKVYNLTFTKENMLFKILESLEGDYYCKDFFQSPQQVYYNLYNAVALNGLKDYIMLQFAYLIKEMDRESTTLSGNYSDLAIIARTKFHKRVNLTMTVFRGAMELVPRLIWRCDPKEHVKGVTYDEFTRLLQGHIENEADMSLTRSCTRNCASYETSQSYGCYDTDSSYCREMERCTGKIIGCKFIESDMEICPSNNPTRRYDYVHYGKNGKFGKMTSCWRKTVRSWYRWFVHCSYCVCLCDEHGLKSDRYINLRPVWADVQKNRVVTGVRLVKHNRILHLQIQQGELRPYGLINNATVEWVPVDDYKITDPNIYNGVDYYTMSYENRTIILDDIRVEGKDYVVTGVSFQLIAKELRLQIITNPIDWKMGRVVSSVSFTDKYIYNSSKLRKSINLDSNPDLPNLSPPSELNELMNGTSLRFTHTGFEADAAQTTIPFIDIQPVYNVPAVPLQGVGIQYKGVNGYGGFLTPIIHTYDYSRLLLGEFPENALSLHMAGIKST